MKPLIDLTEIINILNSKMDANDFNFSKTEVEIIVNNQDLLEKLKVALSNDYNAWQTVSDNVYNLFAYDFDIEFTPELLKNHIRFAIDKGELSNVLDSSYLDDEFLLVIKNYIIKKLNDSTYKPEVAYVGKETLKIIVDSKRMDLLSTIVHVRDMYQETAQIIREYYLNNNEIIPPSFYSHLTELELPFERLNLEALLAYLEQSEESLTVDTYNILLDKIKTSAVLKLNDFNWLDVFKKVSEHQKLELIDILLSKGYYDALVQFIDINDSNIDRYVTKYIHAIEVNPHKELDIFPIGFNSNYLMLLNDERVLKALIENGKILTASYCLNFKNYLDEVVMLINNNPKLYAELNLSRFKNLDKYPSVVLALYKAGNMRVSEYVSKLPELKEEITNRILSGESTLIPSFLINDDSFVNEMIVKGRLDVIFDRVNIVNRNEQFNFSSESCQYIIDKARQDYIFAMQFLSRHTLTVIRNAELLDFYLKANNQAVEIIVNKLNHLEEDKFNYTEEMFLLAKPYLVEKYSLNIEHLDKLETHFGPLVIRYISNKNIQNIINMYEDNFNKILSLFPQIDFTMVDVEKIYDSLKQFEFSKLHSDDIEIFARINHLIVDDNLEYLQELDKLLEVLEIKEDKEKFLKKFSIAYPNLKELIEVNPKEFLVNIVYFIQKGTMAEKNYYTEVLHFITDYYIAFKREKYRETYDMYNSLNIPYELDEKDKIKQFIKNCAVRIHKNLIVLEMTDRGIDESLAIDCVDYYGYDKRDFSDKRIKEIERHIKLLIEITNKILKFTGISETIVDTLDSEKLIKRKYYVEANNSNIFAILSELNLGVLTDTIFSPDNKDVYQSLLTYIYKYKLHLLPDYFKGLMASEYIDINLEVSDVAAFMTYYAQIYEAELKRLNSQGKSANDLNLSFVSIMKYAEAYSSVSNVYNQLLGIEDARLIKSNPKPNAATNKTQGDTRLKLAVEWTLYNFKRSEVTIPTFNEIVEVNNKSLRVVVGNFTHPANLTMGERTGACMRIGGVGESLFNFVLEDKNGFHIRFDDPDTGEFISRVSGFRNGNTVFLNELRYSCNPEKYSNEDVVKACTNAAKMLIDKSQESTCTIDNVVLHHAYATENMDLCEEYLGITDNREGLKKFYSDIKDKGIVLASTGSPFTKVNFNKSNVPSYELAREVSYESSDTNKLRVLINRVHAVKYALGGISYEYIAPIDFEKGIYYGIANQDFYIYIDNEGNIFEEIINIDPRAIIELEEARKTIWGIKTKGQYLEELGLASLKM